MATNAFIHCHFNALFYFAFIAVPRIAPLCAGRSEFDIHRRFKPNISNLSKFIRIFYCCFKGAPSYHFWNLWMALRRLEL